MNASFAPGFAAAAAAAPSRGERSRTAEPPRSPGRRRSDEVHYRLICLATFPFFLLAASAMRLVPARRPAAGAAPRLSVFREARAAAQTCGSFALMG